MNRFQRAAVSRSSAITPTAGLRRHGQSAAPAICTHCGLDVPIARVAAGAAEQFCCEGCRTVYEAIHGCGLDAYYRMRDRLEQTPDRAVVDAGSFETFDDPAFHERWVTRNDDGTLTCALQVTGMHCAACIWLIERVPVVVGGVRECRVDFGSHRVRVTWIEGSTTLSAIARQLNRFGYTPHPKRAPRTELSQREERQALIRIGVAGAIAGNTMVIAFALYGGLFHGMDAGMWTLFRYASLGFAVLALAWPGRVFLRSAWAALRTRTAHIDLPIAVGLLAGVISGAINTVRSSGDVYFDSVTVLIFLLLIGRWLQMRQQRKSQDAIAMLFALTPATARRCEHDDTRIVPVEALQAGDLVEVRPGECIPADGTITTGSTTVNRALLSGESQPVEVGRGDEVSAGVTNCSQRIIMRICATGSDTRIGRLMELVERTANERAPVVETTHRIAGIFVIAVLVLAALTAAVWFPHDPAKALACSMALLIVTCPCALGLATPLAIVSSIGRAARGGILIKGGGALQTLHRPGTMLFDKTGTLTMGTLSVIDWRGPADLKPLVARAERDSTHPAGLALRAAFGEVDFESIEPAPTPTEQIGGGVVAQIDDAEIAVGSERFMRERGFDIPSEFIAPSDAARAEGSSVVYIARNHFVEGMAVVADVIRPEAKAVLTALRARGWRLGVLSGDHPDVVRAMARQLSLPIEACEGGLSPEEKLERVRTSAADAAHGTVVMVGDGVNDAAALAAASVGVAVQGGAEASLAASDVYMARDGIRSIPTLLDTATGTMRLIRRNLVISIGYNAIGAGLAMTGIINPLIAAVLMPISSLTVVAMSFSRSD